MCVCVHICMDVVEGRSPGFPIGNKNVLIRERNTRKVRSSYTPYVIYLGGVLYLASGELASLK